MSDKSTNRLINSTSPYLLQHAHNPVDWFEWGKDALEKAKSENKPILVSIGYSSCHWCHVMERESFENDQVAEVMNSFFVCIKVDREERPDIDQIYMDAVQALGVNGGWPLNVFLTPDQKPFFGGTYFNPQVWVQVLTNINSAFKSRRDEIFASAETLTNHLASQGISQFRRKEEQKDFKQALDMMYKQLESKFDLTWGGLDRAPKFIMPSIWLWLLRYWKISKNESALQHTLFTLKRIGHGGIYDQIGGGFARYSVDGEWFAPHFEKMLYDNAQLLSLYSEAYTISHDEYFKTLVYETFEWLQREMTHHDGGFYSALDADSEGIEGKYYIWKYDELIQLCEPHGKLVADYFEAIPEGNWEHESNILKLSKINQLLLDQHKISESDLSSIIQSAKQKLLTVRNTRIKPGLDDKILTGWNAMMIAGLVDAYHAFGDEKFLLAAKKNADFIQRDLTEGNKLFRSFKGKRSATEGFLEDYAFVIQAFIKLYQATFDESWLHQAKGLTDFTLENFLDKEESYFYFTSSKSEKLIARKKEIFDNAIPASNGVMTQNLFHLGILFDRNDWKDLATSMASELSHLIYNEPNYMSNWGIVLAEIRHGLAEVAFTGKEYIHLKNEFKRSYQPFSLLMGTKTISQLPLLTDKVTRDDTSVIYVCYDKTCRLPVGTVVEALEQIV
ncbi:MAG TPA: thioredoxin domain-containing protein [Cyclobacteriaceae bacterium]|nr:thioredoxin domain-containing protein [Cyclobacteriaceae bacterium]